MASDVGRVNDILIVLLPAGIDLLDVLRHICFGVFFQRFSCSHSRSIMINYSLQNLFVVLSHRSLVRHEFAPGYELLTRPSQRRWPWFPLQFESISFFLVTFWPSGNQRWQLKSLFIDEFPLKYLQIGDFPVCHV